MITYLEEVSGMLERERVEVRCCCFGVVKSGSLQTTPSSECTPGYEGPRQEVAVKLLKHNADQDELVNFLEEGLMMKDLQHPNVLTLIGICIDDRGVPMIILPYMKFGNLKTFIQDKDRVFTVKDMIMLGHQVASGMCYLSEIHRMVHRDLAARNCMVDETKTVKVGDFGLSRDVYEKDYYVCKDNKAKLPAKWMAPECFIMQHYDTKTDVWAYGVLLWELMTRGQTPYPAIDNWNLVDYLKMGKRLQKPPYTPAKLYDVMHACWRLDPDKRPDFKGIVEMLEDIIKPAAKESESDDYMTLIQSTYDYVNSHWQGAPR
ncbi:hepatocyte growth factor receptor-like [Ptychodera flava]|uniref:hepatocyte growth factor receptor-like n=1 Tax=Ptychodera flava TaxID=63121 RepID=UPI00396A2E7A